VVIDRIGAVLLAAGALADASSRFHRGLDAPAIAALVVLTGSVAWRRRNPVLSTVAAVSGLAAFVALSGYNGDGSFQGATIALNFYMLGRRTRGRRGTLGAAVAFAAWLLAAVVLAYGPASGSVGEVIGPWILFGGLPFVIGRVLATRSALTRELAASTARLEGEQEVRARRAAAEERNRMARELHDVIAHSVSVMVIQTSGARRVAKMDLEAAREALAVVDGSGRDALVELRRIVGVLRRGPDELAVCAAPGLSQLDALLERARAAGLPVELYVEGDHSALPPGLDLVAYRVVQEALTNALKHAGRARAEVRVSVGAHVLELEVSDTGRGPERERGGDGSGHGLLGMGERVRLYGGELRAGRRPGGGFEVRTRIPFDRPMPPPQALTPPAGGDEAIAADELGIRWPWLDPVLAGVLLVVLETAVLTTTHRRGPLVPSMLVVAGIALAAVWRRRSPLAFLIVVGLLGAAMNAYLIALKSSPLIGAYFVLVPAYTVAAWEDRRRALLGLAIFVAGTAISELGARHGTPGDFAGATFTFTAAWAAGRAIRARHAMTSELRRTSARLALEREDRARLAVAGERSRIARELHAIVAHRVAAMVVQAEAAQSLLDRDLARADVAMGTIEDTGREVLAEMRRILGVLRHADETGEREPQPGVDQIYALIQRARERGQPIELSVDGEPGTLSAGVDIGVYRIVEDALRTAGRPPGGAVSVALRFASEELELHLSARCGGPSGWPTEAMRERVALCGGELEADAEDEHAWQFLARMPRGAQGVLA